MAWLSRLILLLALISLSGMDRVIVQSYAWVTMVQDRSSELGLEEAVENVLSGSDPCDICVAVTNSAHPDPAKSPLREHCENLPKLYSPWLIKREAFLLTPRRLGRLVDIDHSRARSIILELPTPPPRTA